MPRRDGSGVNAALPAFGSVQRAPSAAHLQLAGASPRAGVSSLAPLAAAGPVEPTALLYSRAGVKRIPTKN